MKHFLTVWDDLTTCSCVWSVNYLVLTTVNVPDKTVVN